METIGLYCALDRKVQEFQRELIKEIASEFNLTKTLIQDIEPHFTLKYWFSLNKAQLVRLENSIPPFCASHEKTKVTIGGYAGFEPGVVFTNVSLSDEAMHVFSELLAQLRAFDWIRWDRYDGENICFHSTLAEECGEKYAAVLKYLEGREIYFDSWFDNITLIRKTGEKGTITLWEPHKTFYLRGLNSKGH